MKRKCQTISIFSVTTYRCEKCGRSGLSMMDSCPCESRQKQTSGRWKKMPTQDGWKFAARYCVENAGLIQSLMKRAGIKQDEIGFLIGEVQEQIARAYLTYDPSRSSENTYFGNSVKLVLRRYVVDRIRRESLVTDHFPQNLMARAMSITIDGETVEL